MITAWRTTILDQLHSHEEPAAAAGPTALSIVKTISHITAGSAGTQDLYTLADGQVDQLKLAILDGGTDTVKITPANLANGTYVELLVAGDYAVFEFNGVEWEVIYLARSASLT